MRWQRVAQALIAVFVIGFIGLLVMTLRRQQPSAQPQQPPPARIDPTASLENPGGGRQVLTDPSGRKEYEITFGTHLALPDGRQRLGGGVETTINRPDRQFVVKAREVDITPGDNIPLKDAVFRQDVRVTGAGGLEIKADQATYAHATGIVDIPGKVDFTKGRMTGSGVGATYDQNRDVFWMREQAQVKVAPGKDGEDALDATAASIGMARMDHYIRLERDARIVGGGRIAQANEIVIRLTPDDQRVQLLELRGNSRITGSGAGVQAMTARDIDMTYAEDGRTLQQAKLVENAVVQLPGTAGGGGRRIAGSTIDIALGPDGTTVTNLSAAQPVQVDLPADGDLPARTILAATLNATGAPGTGLQNAAFGGGVTFTEKRTARRNLPALNRTATSRTLVVETQPVLGAIQKADFQGSVKFTDPPDFVAEGQRGIYDITRDRLDLMPSDGQPGSGAPIVTDGNVSVSARTIQFSLSTREMQAETRVRSTIQPQKGPQGGGRGQGKMPSMLAQDKPVNVTSNRLSYKGAGSAAIYTGNVILWQEGDTTIKAPTIEIDDKNGNLAARGGAATTFIVEEANRKTGERARNLTTGTAETFVYEDAKRLATYTGKAHIVGAQGDVVGERIELYLKGGVNELERAEAYGANGVVQVQEGNRVAKGSHLTYTAEDDRYVMIGTPVEIIEAKDGTCTRTVGASATFNRATEAAQVDGLPSSKVLMRAETLKACPAGLIR